ncbi:MAG: guanylate kinase [Alphaproteobacteria bacterium]|nr:guanylate kinase [Alphaproteobacteria bacterium]
MSNNPADIPRPGVLLVLSAPSGAGKTSIAHGLLAADPALQQSVSATTRTPRPGEVDGQHYRFVAAAEFARMAESGALLEHATVHGHRYGTPRAPVETTLAGGRDLLLVIDWQGARQLREQLPNDVVSVFVLPPSATELERRLCDRGQDTAATIAARMQEASEFVARAVDYDYVLVNTELGRAIGDVAAILRAERHRRARLTGLPAFIGQRVP